MEEAPQQVNEEFMREALEQAKLSGERGDIPIGAVIVTNQGDVIARAGNSRERLNDPTAHAEILAPGRSRCHASHDW